MAKRTVTKRDTDTILNQFCYCSKSGRLTRNGKLVIGYKHSKGYRVVSINDRMFYVHRIVYFLHFGYWPIDTTDHIDGDKENNHHTNLRDVTNRENHNNKLIHLNGRPVGYFLDNGRIRSSIKIKNKSLSLGTFANIEQAHKAYLSKKKQIEGDNYGS